MRSTDLDASRFPPLTPALMFMALHLQTRREIVGMHMCRDREVGPVRRKLGLVPLLPPDTNDPVAVSKDQLRVVLAGLCEECPFESCKMKDWGFMVPPSSVKKIGGGLAAG